MIGKKKIAKAPKQVETTTHDDATRKNLATAELAPLAERLEELDPAKPARFIRTAALPKGATRHRNPDIDPQIIWNGARIRLSPEQMQHLERKGEVEIGDAQLVWHGKDQQDWSDLVVQPPQLYIQEKVHPKAIIDDLIRRSDERAATTCDEPDLFADFNGLLEPEARLEFYQHDQHWSNRMILGDSLLVMASLAEREHLRGQVQCIFIDPPYGIKFNSNWQVSTLSRDVKDGKREDISREPEQVKAFRDTWKDGIHSYLTYLRDRLTVARELLSPSGSIFVQIGDENVHRVRALLDEVFGERCFVSMIAFTKGATGLAASDRLHARLDYLVWYCREDASNLKFRQLWELKGQDGDPNFYWIVYPDGRRERRRAAELETPPPSVRFAQDVSLTKPGPGAKYVVSFEGKNYDSGSRWWGTPKPQLERAIRSGRIIRIGDSLRHLRYLDESSLTAIGNLWLGFLGQHAPIYVVQTNVEIVERCILMATDPGDLVLDPTCGSGTAAYVAEKWARRWITVDTSRVALALARARIMGAKFPYYYLADTRDGRAKEQEVSGKIRSDAPTYGDIRQGFVYERAPRVTLKSIVNNAEIDVIWESFQAKLEPLRNELNTALGKSWQEWEIPREANTAWSDNVKDLHRGWWAHHTARERKFDESISKNADVEFLYDRPYEDRSRVRVAGPFTVESLSPHRVVPADEEELIDTLEAAKGKRRRSRLVTPPTDFAEIVFENLRRAGVHQSVKKDAIKFTSLQGWPGDYIGAEGHFMEGKTERRAAIFLGPEFGTVSRIDLVAAAREATEARFDVLIACAFNFDAHASELTKLGPLPILKAKMNPDLHMADELKNTGKGNLFVVFGEPDIDIEHEKDGRIRVRVKGVDVFDPNTGDIRSNDTKGIAAWFIDTDYDEENFFVRHAYFLGAQDPYKSLKTALKAEIDAEAWETLYRDTSRPFPRPSTGRIAVKVINHFGDEVMKVFSV
jgi:adenine-specific DNA-methyltransferase